MRTVLPVLGLSMLGCSGLFRSTETIEADIQRHLTTRYGVVRHHPRERPELVRRPLPRQYNYAAHPTTDPTLEFVGTADYDARPDEVDDDYAFRKVEC